LNIRRKTVKYDWSTHAERAARAHTAIKERVDDLSDILNAVTRLEIRRYSLMSTVLVFGTAIRERVDDMSDILDAVTRLSPMHVYRHDTTQLNSTQLAVGLS